MTRSHVRATLRVGAAATGVAVALSLAGCAVKQDKNGDVPRPAMRKGLTTVTPGAGPTVSPRLTVSPAPATPGQTPLNGGGFENHPG